MTNKHGINGGEEKMKKLIQTNFAYRLENDIEVGSYLGRKQASLDTLKRFTRQNSNGFKITDIVIGNSFPSQWVAK